MKRLDRLFGRKDIHEEKPSTPVGQDVSKTDMNVEEQRRILISKCLEVLKNEVDAQMNESVFVPCLVSCDFPGTRNKALLRVIPDEADQSPCRLTVNLVREDSDLCVMNYLFKGTRQEISDWLGDGTHVEELMDCIVHLSESLDEKMD